MRELIADLATTVLDIVGLVVLAVGLGWLAYGGIRVWAHGPAHFDAMAHGVGVTVSGVAILVGSWLSDRSVPRRDASGAREARP